MKHLLSTIQEELVLSLFPVGTRIVDATYFQEQYLPCPVRVRIVRLNGKEERVVLRLARHGEQGVEREARLYQVLAQFGLPVPSVLAGPKLDSEVPNIGPVTVLSLLPGKTLQVWSEASPEGLTIAGRLVIEAVRRLQQLTSDITQMAIAAELPHEDMGYELEMIQDKGGPWLRDQEFREAIKILRPVVASIDTPLTFSNGDYQPGNFLSDGERLTGFVDFEGACFEDPHIGFAKYRIYDLHPLNKSGLVGQYLAASGLSEAVFAPRIALRCLSTLQREITVSNQEDKPYRIHVKRLLREAIKHLT